MYANITENTRPYPKNWQNMSVNVIPWNSIVIWSCDSEKLSKRTAEDFGFVQSCGQSPELRDCTLQLPVLVDSILQKSSKIDTIYSIYPAIREIPYWYGGSLKMWDPQVITVVSIRCQGLIWSNKIWEYPHDFGNLDIWVCLKIVYP